MGEGREKGGGGCGGRGECLHAKADNKRPDTHVRLCSEKQPKGHDEVWPEAAIGWKQDQRRQRILFLDQEVPLRSGRDDHLYICAGCADEPASRRCKVEWSGGRVGKGFLQASESCNHQMLYSTKHLI